MICSERICGDSEHPRRLRYPVIVDVANTCVIRYSHSRIYGHARAIIFFRGDTGTLNKSVSKCQQMFTFWGLKHEIVNRIGCLVVSLIESTCCGYFMHWLRATSGTSG